MCPHSWDLILADDDGGGSVTVLCSVHCASETALGPSLRHDVSSLFFIFSSLVSRRSFPSQSVRAVFGGAINGDAPSKPRRHR
jgi:hypothetical protein